MSTRRQLAGVVTWVLLLLATSIAACGRAEQQSSETTADEARAIVSEAYIFAFPMLENYKTMFVQAVDEDGRQYLIRPLGEFLGEEQAAPAPVIDFPPYDAQKAQSIEFISYFNFLLGQLEIHPSETELLERFASVGIGADRQFDPDELDPAIREAMEEGAAAGHEAVMEERLRVGTELNRWTFVGEAFGSRSVLQGKYLLRAAGAAVGLYRNDVEEAGNLSGGVDSDGDALDASEHDYVIRFESDQMPPGQRVLVDHHVQVARDPVPANPINRHSISDRTEGIEFGEDGSLTIYVQHESPGADRESNWLPASNGPFGMAMRIYWPKAQVLDGTWSPPFIEKAR